MTITPFPFISISGSPRERGLEYGRKALAEIHRSEVIYVRAMERRGFQWPEVRQLAREFMPAVGRFDQRYLDEMEGIAAGAGVDLETVIVTNARSEIFNGRTPKVRQAFEEALPTEGCTSALAMRSATRDGRLIHGQNWDFNAECVHSAIVLRVERDDGPTLITFVEAGGLARCGFNAAGIAITANNLKCDRDLDRNGVPLSLIRRRVLEAPTLAEATGEVIGAERAISNNMTISAAFGDEAINLETTPGEVFPLWPNSHGLFTHANHFNSPVAQAKVVDLGINEGMPCSTLYRDRRVMRHLEPRMGDLTVQDFKSAFADTFGAPHAVCGPPVAGPNGIETSTVATVIFDAEAGDLHARPGPYDPETEFAVYSLENGLIRAAAE